jgi:hypothetical protein
VQADGIFDKYADTSGDIIGPEGDCHDASNAVVKPVHAHHVRCLEACNKASDMRGACAGVERFCTDLGLDPSDKRVSYRTDLKAGSDQCSASHTCTVCCPAPVYVCPCMESPSCMHACMHACK